MPALRITIPEGLAFEALQLSRSAAGIKFDWRPIESICAASGIDIALLRNTGEDNIAGMIITWYAEHRARGGAPDAVAEQLIAEVAAEIERGQTVAHQPGRA